MDIATIAGFLLVCLLLIIGMGFNLSPFVDVSSMLIVVGGTLSSILMAYPFTYFFKSIFIIKNTIKSKHTDKIEIINGLIIYAEKARKEGMLSLEKEIDSIDDIFLKRGIQLIVDGIDPELVKKILEREIEASAERHATGKGMLDNAASLAPAYGMIGTLIGLIQMLGNLSDPGSLGPAMALALITTFYGSFIANAIFTPMAVKLGIYSAKEILLKELIMDGVLSIQAGDNPRVLEERLKAYLSPVERYKVGGREEEF